MRALTMLYGIMSYFLFFGTFVYLIAFVGDIYVPKTVSSAAYFDPSVALAINAGLLLLWGLQHSVMARPAFKNAISAIVPAHTERTTYVLLSSVVLAALMYFWQPIAGTVWQIESTGWQTVIWAIFALGWSLTLASSFLTNHFDLFGLRQTWLYYVKKSYTSVQFSERFVYRWIRHPMMVGMLISFWATPHMDTGHLFFSIGMSVYILIGIYFEEKGLAKSIGMEYTQYQTRTAKLIPKVF